METTNRYYHPLLICNKPNDFSDRVATELTKEDQEVIDRHARVPDSDLPEGGDRSAVCVLLPPIGENMCGQPIWHADMSKIFCSDHAVDDAARRKVWEKNFGLLHPSMEPVPVCGNEYCINIRHVKCIGRMFRRGRSGHPEGVRAAQIICEWFRGYHRKEICKRYGISQPCLSKSYVNYGRDVHNEGSRSIVYGRPIYEEFKVARKLWQAAERIRKRGGLIDEAAHKDLSARIRRADKRFLGRSEDMWLSEDMGDIDQTWRNYYSWPDHFSVWREDKLAPPLDPPEMKASRYWET